MQEVRLSDSLNSGDFTVLFDLGDFSRAGADYLAVQNDGARSADACAAANLCSGKAETTNYIRQCILFRIADEHSVRAVDLQCHLFEIHNCLHLIIDLIVDFDTILTLLYTKSLSVCAFIVNYKFALYSVLSPFIEGFPNGIPDMIVAIIKQINTSLCCANMIYCRRKQGENSNDLSRQRCHFMAKTGKRI